MLLNQQENIKGGTDFTMAAIKSVLPQIPKELQLPGTSLATEFLEDWGI